MRVKVGKLALRGRFIYIPLRPEHKTAPLERLKLAAPLAERSSSTVQHTERAGRRREAQTHTHRRAQQGTAHLIGRLI